METPFERLLSGFALLGYFQFDEKWLVTGQLLSSL